MFDKILHALQRIDLIKMAVAITVLVSMHQIVTALVTKEIPDGNRDIIIHTLGLIEGVVVGISSFYWGSSQGSKDKTEHMADAMKEPKKE